MKIINCPLNGPRNAQEFHYGGEVLREPAAGASLIEWSRYVFLEDNRSDVVDEWWCHTASSYWFIVRRDRTRDEIVASYSVQEYEGEKGVGDES